MKTKFKDLLLYSLATIGVVALFISATQPQASHVSPESHVWEFHLNDPAVGPHGSLTAMAFAINKKTGEVRKYESQSSSYRNSPFAGYIVAPKSR